MGTPLNPVHISVVTIVVPVIVFPNGIALPGTFLFVDAGLGCLSSFQITNGKLETMTESFTTTSTTALAAAVAAAAEIAKHNEAFFLTNSHVSERTAKIPMGFARESLFMSGNPHNSQELSRKLGLCTGQDVAGEGKHLVHAGIDESSNEKSFQASEMVEGEEGAEKRLARSRERNREHARRTRLRKKAQLAALQSKVKGLEAESRCLKQSIEECSIASILVGLSSGPDAETLSLLDRVSTSKGKEKESTISFLTGGKRKRFVSVDSGEEKAPMPLKLKIDGQTTLIGGTCKSHINWKSGVYSDENGVQRQLTSGQLESLRRERNRMHAKMTRDRKKNFISTIEKVIADLEAENQKMKDILSKVGHKHFSKTVTPLASPKLVPLDEPKLTDEEVGGQDDNSVHSSASACQETMVSNDTIEAERPAKRKCQASHGFSLNN